MFDVFVETILGLITGLFLGITGIAPTGIVLLILDILKIGDYRSNLGTIAFLNLFPITLGSSYDFYRAKKIRKCKINRCAYPLEIVSLTTIVLLNSVFLLSQMKDDA